MKKTILLALAAILMWSCDKSTDEPDPISDILDRFVIVSNITTAATPTAYIGTFKDLNVGNYTNSKAQQFTSYPFISTYGDDVFVCQNRGGDLMIKYTRQTGGTLLETGRLSNPSGSQPMHVIVVNDNKAFLSLYNTGKIVVFNPRTMTTIETIDLSSFAKGDGSPDPGIMLFKDGKLYVPVSQTTDTYTSDKPAEMLIIDTNDRNKVISITDDRATFLGNLDSPHSMFFDEKGDLYVYALSSWGFYPGQKAGWLRVKSGEIAFDKSYFFNTTDYVIQGVQGGHIDYLQHPSYYANGIVYSAGNIPALASNPPDYVKDRTFGAFKVDVYNQTITKLDIPNSNGYAASVLSLAKDGKALFGMSGTTGVGIYSYDHATGATSSNPLITVQGDPSMIEVFKK